MLLSLTIVEPDSPFMAFLKLFRLTKDSGILLLFISESVFFALNVLHKQHAWCYLKYPKWVERS